MRTALEKNVKSNLVTYIKSSPAAKDAVRKTTFSLLAKMYENHIGTLDDNGRLQLKSSYETITGDSIISKFFKMCICNVIDDREVAFDSIITSNGTDVTAQFSLFVVLACIPYYLSAISHLIDQHKVGADYVRNMMGKLRYRVKLHSTVSKTIGVAGGVNVVLWIQQHIHFRRISYTCIDIERMQYHKGMLKTKDQIVCSLSDGTICQVHLIDDRKISGQYEFINTLTEANKFFFDLYGFFPQAYIFSAWTLDPAWKKVFPNSFLSTVCSNVHIVDDLKEESDEIFFYVYGKKCDPRQFPADTKLKQYLVANYNKKFYVHFGIVKVESGKVMFES